MENTENESHKGATIFFCITTIILSILVTIFFTQYNKINDEYVEISNQMSYQVSVKHEYSSRINELQQEYTDSVEAADFFNEHAVLCIDDDNTYHKYNCSFVENNSFYVYNVEYAEYMGYEPCPYCCKNDYRNSK